MRREEALENVLGWVESYGCDAEQAAMRLLLGGFSFREVDDLITEVGAILWERRVEAMKDAAFSAVGGVRDSQ